jgi:hypothetical protein
MFFPLLSIVIIKYDLSNGSDKKFRNPLFFFYYREMQFNKIAFIFKPLIIYAFQEKNQERY